MTALDTITSKFDELVKCTNDLLKAVLSGSYEKGQFLRLAFIY